MPARLSVDRDKTILKYTQKGKGIRTAKPILKMKNKMGGIILPDFKTSYTATEIRTMWNCQEDRHMDQRNRAEDPEIAPQSTKGAEVVQ